MFFLLFVELNMSAHMRFRPHLPHVEKLTEFLPPLSNLSSDKPWSNTRRTGTVRIFVYHDALAICIQSRRQLACLVQSKSQWSYFETQRHFEQEKEARNLRLTGTEDQASNEDEPTVLMHLLFLITADDTVGQVVSVTRYESFCYSSRSRVYTSLNPVSSYGLQINPNYCSSFCTVCRVCVLPFREPTTEATSG
jgi:hypothetical protein